MRSDQDLRPISGFTIDMSGDFRGLYICDACGWHVIPIDVSRHKADQCRPKAGRAAKNLIAQFPQLKGTQHGYGDGIVAFKLGHGVGVSFRVHDKGRFSLEDVWCLDSVDHDKAAALVGFLAKWVES